MQPSRRLKRFAHAVQRRLTVGVALGGYLLAVTGYPLPARVAKDLSRPFPCQDHACGCTSAEQCWESCCCYNDEEKLAWARENNVEPPASLLDRIKHSGHAQHNHGAVSHGEAAHCEHRHECGAAGGCCSARSHGSCANCARASSRNGGDSSVRFVIASLARQCRGMAESWCSSGAVAPPPPLVAWQFDWNVIERLSEQTSLILSRDLAPPSPPPRV